MPASALGQPQPSATLAPTSPAPSEAPPTGVLPGPWSQVIAPLWPPHTVQCVHTLVHTRVHTLDTHVCAHVHTRQCVHVLSNMCVHACASSHVCTWSSTCMCTHLSSHMSAHVHSQASTQHTHLRTSTCSHAHTNVHTQEHPRSPCSCSCACGDTLTHGRSPNTCTQAWGTAGSSLSHQASPKPVCKALGPRQGAGRVAARGNLQLCDALWGGKEMPPGGRGTCPEGPCVGRARMAPSTGWPDPLSRDLPPSGVPLLAHPGLLTQPMCHRINIYWIFPAQPQS